MLRPELASVALLLFINFNWAVHDSLNFVVEPKRRECFYQDFPKDALPHIVEVFVESGGGNVDLTLQIFGPLSLDQVKGESFESPLIQEKLDTSKEVSSETQSFIVKFDPSKSGTYAFCLDNRRSHFIPKSAQLDVYLAPRSEDEESIEDKQPANDSDENLQRVKEAISRIRHDLVKIQLFQRRDRHRLTLHSEANETGHNRVIIAALVETGFFVAASLFQIFFVRRWFSSRSSGNKLRA
eukprot:gene12714-26781_t